MKNWIKDIVTILLAVSIWWFTPYLTRMLDPTAGVDDAGFLQGISFALVKFLIYHSFIKIFMKMFWPDLDSYLAQVFCKSYATTTLWQEYYLPVIFYLASMIALAIMF